jgi:tRNA 2-selenouridine synthase
MFQDITLHDLFERQNVEPITLIDVRSPQEFVESTIPGSINIPVFDNEERAKVGTLYKQVGPEAAKEKGLEIFSAKLPSFIASFQSIETKKVVYCWRGGMRSKTAATVLDLMGIQICRLDGGIRSYRKWVMHTLEKNNFTPKMYVLNGYTGCGKTILLKRLKEQGYPVLDLEGMANHRGSVFGQIGLVPHNQKTFESLLVQEMQRYDQTPFILLEGESKRIGKVSIPPFLYEGKEAGMQLFVHLPLEQRIDNILSDYNPTAHKEQAYEAFQRIRKHIHTPIAKQISSNIEQGNFRSAITLLLENYYDPRYEHAIKHYPNDSQTHIHANNLDEAYEAIVNFIKREEKNRYVSL